MSHPNRMLYLGLGSNQGDRVHYIQRAIDLLQESIAPICMQSTLIETAAWGFDSPNNFLNGVVALETNLDPLRLLDITQQIEIKLGRTYKRHSSQEDYHDRTIDIDMLLLGDMVFRSKRLILPHPEMITRDFVMCPLAEIQPNLIHPLLGVNIVEISSKL